MTQKRALALLLALLTGGCGAEGVSRPPPDGPGLTDGMTVEAGLFDSGACTTGQMRGCYTGPKGTQAVGECKAGMQSCTAGTWGTCEGEILPINEACDTKDNDCDGQTDEESGKSCYSGPSGTQGVGECKAGSLSCAGDTCTGAVLPGTESCDGKDNDCDGQTDESLTKSCYSGPSGTQGVGDCKAGTQSCSSGNWSTCAGEVTPAAESCDSRDNDCDGSKDEGLSRSCYTGPAGTENVGACKAGAQTCSNGLWGSCSGQVLPATETCDGKDNDCDGQTDESVVQSCYSGPSGTAGVGPCKAGTQTCSGGVLGPCVGQVLPATESCDNVDNDCDGSKDEALSQTCYTGPAGTSGVGPCKSGTSTCAAGVWGSCAGQVVPQTEGCDNVDNDCDGSTDESLTSTCYTGPSGTNNVGPCHGGTRTCTTGSWGSCVGQVVPATETCDNIDNDCDGTKDEGVTQSCYSGPAGTNGVGVCHGGTLTCTAGVWGTTCNGQVLPAATDTCGDSLDNNCNAQIDEGCTPVCHSVCQQGAAMTASCGGVTSAVCTNDPFCCMSSGLWDSLCVSEAYTFGRSLACTSFPSCAHSPCATGVILASGCDSGVANCVAQICAADPWCCTNNWDTICVGEVATVCKNGSGQAMSCATN